MKWLLVVLCAMVLMPAAYGDEVTRSTFPNGLRLTVKADPGTDIVAIDLLLDISAADEPAEKAGIRYLTQRLLLRGSKNETGDGMAQRLSRVGGVADTSIGLDYVEVYALVPADGFELALSMLADIVRAPAFLPEQVEQQRQSAAETSKAGYQDPFQATYLALREGLYGDGPYARSTLGEPRSLAAITRENVLAFHREYYVPGRAVLAICGGISPARALHTVRAGFGDWRGSAIIPRPKQATPPLPSSEVVARELPIRRAQLMIGFPAPAVGEPGYYELQIIDSLLTGRSGARLPKLIREQLGLAYEVSSFYPTLAGPSHFAIHVVTEPYALDAVRTAVIDALTKLAHEPPSAEELARAKRYLLGSYALGRQRMKDQAYALAWYEILGLGSDFGERYVAAEQAVTPSQVQQAAATLTRGFVLAVTMPAD